MSSFHDRIDWIFDLDNTLYPASSAVFAQIHDRMAQYVGRALSLDEQAARDVRHQLYRKYGSTMRGLMVEHGTDPHHYMDFVHDVNLSGLAPPEGLKEALAALPGRRIVHTNASEKHARNIMAHLGIADIFEDVFDIAAGDFVPKPDEQPYRLLQKRHAVTPARAVMFEDMAENLRVPAGQGMTTVMVIADEESMRAAGGVPDQHVHHRTETLPEFLKSLAEDNGWSRTPSKALSKTSGSAGIRSRR